MASGTKWAQGSEYLTTAQGTELAFSSPDYRNLMVYDKGILSGTSGSVAHPFGYGIGYDGAIKYGGKYFLNFHGESMSKYGFESPATQASMSSDTNSLDMTCTASGQLMYIIYANPLSPSGGEVVDSPATHGVIYSQDGYDLSSGSGRRSFDTSYQMPLVIKAGTMSASLPGISVPVESTREQTAFADYPHGQPQANWVISPSFIAQVGWAIFNPAGVGFGGVRADYGLEAYIDSSKIRYRVSRTIYNYGSSSSYNPGPATISSNYYLTNIALP